MIVSEIIHYYFQLRFTVFKLRLWLKSEKDKTNMSDFFVFNNRSKSFNPLHSEWITHSLNLFAMKADQYYYNQCVLQKLYCQ